MIALIGSGTEFQPPQTSDFWLPLFGTDGAFAITRPMVLALLSVVIASVLLYLGVRKVSVVPSRPQFTFEIIHSLVRNSLARELIGSREFLAFVPFLFTLFVFILINNVFGVTPLVNFPTTSRIGFSFSLALLVMFVYHTVGIKRYGFKGYFAHMLPSGIPTWIKCVLFPLELITYFITRPGTLALRLFGNMFAGHILLVLFILGGEYLMLHSSGGFMIAAGGLSWVMAFLVTLFELFIECLHAYIFTLLSAIYIASSIASEH